MPGLALTLLWACPILCGAASLYLLLRGAIRAHHERTVAAQEEPTFLLKSRLVPDVAVLAMPPDASETSFQFVRKLAKLYFGHVEILLVLDGASNEELQAWKDEFHLLPAPRVDTHSLPAEPVLGVYASAAPVPLVVVEKERGGEGDCLNAGINLTSAPVIGLVDWNAEVSEGTLLRLICPLIDEPERIQAVCAVAPSAPARGLAARLYHLDFLRQWLCRCAGLSIWNSFLPATGSFLLLKRDAVVETGGFKRTPGCALEMVIRLHREAVLRGRRYQVRLITGPFSRPAAPRSNREMNERIAREQSATADALSRHLGTLFVFGSISRLIPGLFCSRLFLPLGETMLLALACPALLFRWVPPVDLVLLISTMAAAGIVTSMTAVLLEPFAAGSHIPPREMAALFFTSIVENLGCRQWRNIKLIGHFMRGFFCRDFRGN
ncbi:MAG TPA: hypothetical protein VMH28_07795 [Candidatus Acidoferrales bacterium]|nr:hypothetical protein [Candidatus Acidoferrales bacterium]